MKHTTSRLLFAYWDEIRGERAAPDRADIEPGRMRTILADTFVLADDHGGGPTFRLCGTRCSALFGRDLKGVSFGALWSAESRGHIERLLGTVVNETAGLVAGAVGTTRAGTSLPLEILLLPLRHRGRPHTRMIGALSPATVPSWAGLFAVTSLELGATRVLRTDPARPDAVQADEALERRRRFVVLDGGRLHDGGFRPQV